MVKPKSNKIASPAKHREQETTQDQKISAPSGPVYQRTGQFLSAIEHNLRKDYMFAYDQSGQLFYYADGRYEPTDRMIAKEGKRQMENMGANDYWTPNFSYHLEEALKAVSPPLWTRPPSNMINVKGCRLSLGRSKPIILPSDPSWLSPIQFNAQYNPDAKCPNWDNIQKYLLPEDAPDLLAQLVMWLMLPDNPMQKAILFLGEGGEGKGTLIDAIQALLSPTAYSTVPLHQLEKNHFATTRLIGKLAVFCGDMSVIKFTDTPNFKAITGNDEMYAEVKHGELFSFKPFCKMVMSANRMPASREGGKAWFRRWLVVPFDRPLPDHLKRTRDAIHAILASPEELSGILNKALAQYTFVHGCGVHMSPSMTTFIKEEEEWGDDTDIWLQQHIVECPGQKLSIRALRAAYVESEKVLSPLSTIAIGRKVKKLFPHTRVIKKDTNNGRENAYSDLTLNGYN